MLAPGARIAVISPSGISDPARLDAGLALLRDWGYAPELLPHATERHRYLAGEDGARLADLLEAFSGRWDAVWMARGGFGLGRLLPHLKVKRLAPVPFFGFSDGTALLNPLARRRRVAVHAPVLNALGSHNDEASRQWLRSFLRTGEESLHLGQGLLPGRAHGRLVGGNLCVLASLCGTRHQLDADGAIVLLEEVGEAPYKVDRLLTQCIESGAFAGAAGFVLGDFLDARVPEGEGWSVADVVRDRLAPLGVPVLAGLAVGHGRTNLALPLGVRATLNGDTLRVGRVER